MKAWGYVTEMRLASYDTVLLWIQLCQVGRRQVPQARSQSPLAMRVQKDAASTHALALQLWQRVHWSITEQQLQFAYGQQKAFQQRARGMLRCPRVPQAFSSVLKVRHSCVLTASGLPGLLQALVT